MHTSTVAILILGALAAGQGPTSEELSRSRKWGELQATHRLRECEDVGGRMLQYPPGDYVLSLFQCEGSYKAQLLTILPNATDGLVATIQIRIRSEEQVVVHHCWKESDPAATILVLWDWSWPNWRGPIRDDDQYPKPLKAWTVDLRKEKFRRISTSGIVCEGYTMHNIPMHQLNRCAIRS